MVEKIFPTACGGLMLQQRKIVRRKKGLPSTSPKGQSATSGGNKEGKRAAWSELEPGKHRGKNVFSKCVDVLIFFPSFPTT